MSVWQVSNCRSWLNGGGGEDIFDQEKRTWPPPFKIAFLQNASAGIVGELAVMQFRTVFPDVKNTELLFPWKWRLLGRVVRGALVGGSLLTVQDAMMGRTMKDFKMPWERLYAAVVSRRRYLTQYATVLGSFNRRHQIFQAESSQDRFVLVTLFEVDLTLRIKSRRG